MYTNNTGIPLSLAVFLAHDEYDHNPDPNTISATALIKPIKQIILGGRVPPSEGVADISGMIASSIGTAIHNGVETAWKEPSKAPLKALGIPQSVIDQIKINPTKEELTENTIPVYMEQRVEKEIMGFTVTGKYDFVLQGELTDFKSTGVYTHIKKTNDEKYALQGSIYRWLSPDKITEDVMKVGYIFLDWKASELKRQKIYPASKILEYPIPLKSLPETEAYIENKLTQLIALMDVTEEEMPACTPEELWQDESVFKYYKNPNKTKVSTKNFSNFAEANLRYIKDGSVGIVKEIKSKAKACTYCNAAPICEQAKALVLQGLS